MNNVTAQEALIAAFANLAREPHVLPTPARTAELDAEFRRYRREAQVRLNVVGLPRGLRVAA